MFIGDVGQRYVRLGEILSYNCTAIDKVSLCS